MEPRTRQVSIGPGEVRTVSDLLDKELAPTEIVVVCNPCPGMAGASTEGYPETSIIAVKPGESRDVTGRYWIARDLPVRLAIRARGCGEDEKREKTVDVDLSNVIVAPDMRLPGPPPRFRLRKPVLSREVHMDGYL